MPACSILSPNACRASSAIPPHGKLTEADVDKAMREIRLALLEADVNFKVVKEFVKTSRSAPWARTSWAASHPRQQVVKIVDEELIDADGLRRFPADLRGGRRR